MIFRTRWHCVSQPQWCLEISLDPFINGPVPVQMALLKSVVWVWSKSNTPAQQIKHTPSQAPCLRSKETCAVASPLSYREVPDCHLTHSLSELLSALLESNSLSWKITTSSAAHFTLQHWASVSCSVLARVHYGGKKNKKNTACVVQKQVRMTSKQLIRRSGVV